MTTEPDLGFGPESRGLPSPHRPATSEDLARRLVAAGGSHVRAVLLYGSHLLGTNPDRHSAVDFVVLVDRYADFYRALRTSGEMPRPPWLMAAMARVLAPNVIAFLPEEGAHGVAKCLIVTMEDFETAMGPGAHDHFFIGRMVQKVGVVWAASGEESTRVEAIQTATRARVLDWMAPYLEGAFNAETLGRRLLEVCYGGELRPEARDRAGEIHAAQADYFRIALQPAIERGLADGRVVQVGEAYRIAGPLSLSARAHWRWYFVRSKTRATLRWLKHMVTFANWLPYVVRKVERHTGEKIVLTRLERRVPFVFLWPRAMRLLLKRPERRVSR